MRIGVKKLFIFLVITAVIAFGYSYYQKAISVNYEAEVKTISINKTTTPPQKKIVPKHIGSKKKVMGDDDNDEIPNEEEIEVWGSDPNNINTDDDRFSDLIEINNGYNPALESLSKIEEDELKKKITASAKLEDELRQMNNDDFNDGITFFKTKNTSETNRFEHEEGLFRFEYKNTQNIKKFNNIYYSTNLKDNKVTFQIFENNNQIEFDESQFQCETYNGKNILYNGKTICFSFHNPNETIANLELFGRKDRFLREQMAYLAARSKLEYKYEVNKYDFFTRAQALQLALSLRYPSTNFSGYKENCFTDVTPDHPLSEYICYAQENEIVIGINGKFYPESSINLFGILKILFKTFEIEDREFDESKLDSILFDEMTTIHYAYPLVAKSLYEGIFENPIDKSLWSNQSVTKGEVIKITNNFLDWIDGKIINNYNSLPEVSSSDLILIDSQKPIFRFKERKNISMSKENAAETHINSNNELFIKEKGNIFTKILNLNEDEKIKTITGFYNKDKLAIELKKEYEDGTIQHLETDISNDQYKFLKNEFPNYDLLDTTDKFESMGILPNNATLPGVNVVPKINIFMEESDFHDLFAHRTSDKRYRAYMIMTYPDDTKIEKSILIKTRGNANKGYVKSSYTIESHTDFKDNKDFIGDEFLNKNDEIKLRSFINEETLIHEKLFYDTFKKLGHIAPDFFEATLEINGIQMGFYQVTEPIKKAFFKNRNISTDNYYYARNSGSKYNTNLSYYIDDDTTTSQYKVIGSTDKLLDLIHSLDNSDPDTIWKIDKETIYDYAKLAYLANAEDSLTHNYYVYIDDTTEKWSMFPWDADASFEEIPKASEYGFQVFSTADKNIFNNLILYLFKNIDKLEKTFYSENFKKKWNNNVHLLDDISEYQEKYESYFQFENELWNGKYIERKKTVFDTPKAIENLKEDIKKINQYLN